MKEKRWFVTVDWCNQGRRGVFCSREGDLFSKSEEEGQHTEDEMSEYLGAFELILNPRSVLMTVEELAEYNRWLPLGEYSGQFGIARKSAQESE